MNLETVMVRDLRVGDLVDLEGDRFADPRKDNALFECELGSVACVIRETPRCVAIGIEGADVYGFPPDHVVRRQRREDAYPDQDWGDE